jgi:hypothetical protein
MFLDIVLVRGRLRSSIRGALWADSAKPRHWGLLSGGNSLNFGELFNQLLDGEQI